jgi:hypothetical protein
MWKPFAYCFFPTLVPDLPETLVDGLTFRSLLEQAVMLLAALNVLRQTLKGGYRNPSNVLCDVEMLVLVQSL